MAAKQNVKKNLKRKKKDQTNKPINMHVNMGQYEYDPSSMVNELDNNVMDDTENLIIENKNQPVYNPLMAFKETEVLNDERGDKLMNSAEVLFGVNDDEPQM